MNDDSKLAVPRSTSLELSIMILDSQRPTARLDSTEAALAFANALRRYEPKDEMVDADMRGAYGLKYREHDGFFTLRCNKILGLSVPRTIVLLNIRDGRLEPSGWMAIVDFLYIFGLRALSDLIFSGFRVHIHAGQKMPEVAALVHH